MRVKKSVCRKEQGKAEHGNTCLQTPGTCESCPNWWKRESNAEELYRASRRGFEKFKAELASHYAAREREVQELQRAGERALSIRNLVHSQYRLVWQPKPSVDADANSMADEYENMAQDCENELRAALAPFAAKGETGSVAAQGEQHEQSTRVE